MLEIVQLPLARRMWRLSKFFHLPLNDPRMQEITPYDLSFYEYSMIADDPDKLEQLQNHYYDPEFDDWLEEFDREQEEKAAKLKQEKQTMLNLKKNLRQKCLKMTLRKTLTMKSQNQ